MRPSWGRVAIAVAAVAVALVAVVVGRALPAAHDPESPPATPLALDEQAAVLRFAAGLRIPTISHPEGAPRSHDPEAFRALHAHLERSYPNVHAKLARETVSEWSLLYTWRGREPSLDPLVLMGHLDVVPVEPGTESAWEEPPFGGRVQDGSIWGRGAIDDKFNVFGLLEAAEHLLAEGFRPRRTILLAFGHDEELGGDEGAGEIAKLLGERGVHAFLVVDEGGAIARGLIPGADFPVAAVGIAEKGYVSVELVVEAEGGHSSAPPDETGIGILAHAVAALEDTPMPARLAGPIRDTLEAVGAHLPFHYRIVTSNLWLFGPLVRRGLESMPSGNAVLRTTTAPTILEAGVKDNILPIRSRAVVNFRIFPGDTIDGVLDHVRRAVDDPRVKIDKLPKRREPSSVSPADSEAFELLAGTIRQVFPGAVVAPHLIPGGTDARHFRRLAENVYGFMPAQLDAGALKRMHGRDEHVPTDAFLDGIRFYAQLVRNAAG